MHRAWLERQWWQPRVSPGAGLLRPLSWLYQGLYALHRATTEPTRLPVPVVVVGNLVVGGAGKTPTTIALVRALQARGYRPGVVSRGHGRDDRSGAVVEVRHDASCSKDTGDEPLLIARRTRCPVFVGRKRLAAAQALLAAHGQVNVIVADDGLQHHALARDAALIVIDERGFGNGLTLPAGPLRQPLPNRPPAASCVLYNADHASTHWPGDLIAREIANIEPLEVWRTTGLAPTEASVSSLSESLAHLVACGPVTVAAGIAVPERFFAMMEQCGLPAKALPLRDHDPWTHVVVPGDGPVLVTEKDAVKISPDHPLASRVWVATLDFKLPDSSVDAIVGMLGPRPPDDR